MGFHIGLQEEVIRQAVAQHYLGVEPAIWVARAARIEQVVAIEDSFVLYSARGGGLGISSRFQFLDGVKQVESYMETCGELPYNELRLQADTQAPAVGGFGGGKVGLPEMGLTRFVSAVVEEVKSTAKAEDRMGKPIG